MYKKRLTQVNTLPFVYQNELKKFLGMENDKEITYKQFDSTNDYVKKNTGILEN